MASMSYCRWHNALIDVRAGLDDFYNGNSTGMSDEEKAAMLDLVQEIADLIDNEGGEVELGRVEQSIEHGVSETYEPYD